jgi:hypothetical protein
MVFEIYHTNYSGKLQCLVPIDMKDLKHHSNYSGKSQCLVPVDMKDLKHHTNYSSNLNGV